MNLYSIAFQSLKRRKTKSIFLVVGLILSVTSVVTLITVSEQINNNISKSLDEFGANIIVTPKTENLRLNYGGLVVDELSYGNSRLTESDIKKIKTIKNSKNISTISPKLFDIRKVKGKSVLIAGIRFDDELKLKKWWRIGGRIPNSSSEVLIGENAALLLNVRKSDSLNISNQNYYVSGILNGTGSQDDEMIFIDLETAQKIFNRPEQLSLIELAALCYDCPIEEIVEQTSNAVPTAKVTPIKQSIESKMLAVHSFEHFTFGISAVILAISFLVVFTNVNASVVERTKEIGIFKSVGFRDSHIQKIIFLEILITSTIAGVLGYLLGLLTSWLILPHLNFTGRSDINFNLTVFITAVGLSLFVALAASIYPAAKATKLDPTVAFRHL